jgi:hypothetical protein
MLFPSADAKLVFQGHVGLVLKLKLALLNEGVGRTDFLIWGVSSICRLVRDLPAGRQCDKKSINLSEAKVEWRGLASRAPLSVRLVS